VRDRAADKIAEYILPIPFLALMAWLHFGLGVRLTVFALGAASWVAGVWVKVLLYHTVVKKLPHEEPGLRRTALLNGTLSGLSELGLALAFFALLGRMSLADLVAFGTSIGAVEAMIAIGESPLKGTALQGPIEQVEEVIDGLSGPRRVFYRHWMPMLERIMAGIAHVSTRGLVYVAWHTRSPLPFAIALAFFILADGTITYRRLAAGRLTDLATFRRTEYLLFGLSLILLAAFAFFWWRLGT
jgi:hypothetical protein